jgi:hypothetical protein
MGWKGKEVRLPSSISMIVYTFIIIISNGGGDGGDDDTKDRIKEEGGHGL